MACVCSARPVGGAANVLPEIKKQLAAAHKYLADGSWQYAVAHADLVLISDNVSISINVEKVAPSQRQTCIDALNAACSVWESALGKSLRFHVENDPSKADLKVTFRPNVQMGNEAVAGLTKWTRDIRTSGGQVTDVSFRADVSVRTRGLDSRSLSFESIRQETEHELGHVLGLDDSDRLGDLMGELDAELPVSGPRDYEILAVKSLREEAKHVKTEAEAKRKSAAQ